MALLVTITTAVSKVAQSSDCLRLFHGTLPAHTTSLRQGITGEFWATPDLEIARYQAELAIQQQILVGGCPGLSTSAILAFDLSYQVLDNFQDKQPEPWLWLGPHGYRFTPACSATLNTEMQNIEITFEE